MSKGNRLVIGIQIEKDMGQVSYSLEDWKEPETIVSKSEPQDFCFETVAYKYKGEDRWSFGENGYKGFLLGELIKVEGFVEAGIEGQTVIAEEKEFLATDILEAFINFLLVQAMEAADCNDIRSIAVCTGLYYKNVLDLLYGILVKMLPETEIILLNKEESFVYYALSMKEELRRNAMALFEYNNGSLQFHTMELASYGKKLAAVIESKSTVINNESEEQNDKCLLDAAEEYLGKDIFSAVYLTGKDFAKEYSYDEFIRCVCRRRRVFLGQNLYSKGACYYALRHTEESFLGQLIVAGKDKILCDIDIEILESGTPKAFRIVRAGSSWYESGKTADFIVCGEGKLIIDLLPIEKKDARQIVIDLMEFPVRPDRTTRIGVSLIFENEESMKVIIEDKGFGRMFRASGHKIIREISLKEG